MSGRKEMDKTMEHQQHHYFVDSHCHLDMLADSGRDVAAVLQAAEAVGVKKFLSISTKMETFPQVLAIAERFPAVYASVGVHPHDSAARAVKNDGVGDDDLLATLLAACAHEKVIGIGESGLDFFYNHSDRVSQEQSFRCHARVARQTGLPLIVHSRAADEDTVRVLQDESAGGQLRGLIHCFSTGATLLKGALDLGFYISLSGIITFPKAGDLRDLVAEIPLDKLLLETDAPYLAPAPHRGRQNESAFLPHTAAVLADIKKIDIAALQAITTENFYHLFQKCR
ncbi:MAG: TatD family hydrolase [Alphaproteobacteria bacterium]|nr:TatD family hydrolase [Alphaproteobacteria bacterium]